MEDLSDTPDKNNEQPADDQSIDIEYLYSDSDAYMVEIAELYSYSEKNDILLNKKIHEEDFKKYTGGSNWKNVSEKIRFNYILYLMERLELSSTEQRMHAARSVLYLVQGVFGSCELEEDQLTMTRDNVYLCLRCGIYQQIVNLLLLEIEIDDWLPTVNPNAPVTAGFSPPVMDMSAKFSDCTNLRIILSILYTIVETVRDEASVGCSSAAKSNKELRKNLIEELNQPILNDDQTTLSIVLFGMVHRFCSRLAPHFPMKKTLLLLWKVLLVTCGPVTGLFDQRNAKRKQLGLPPLTEDTHEVVKRIRASSPPPSTAENTFSKGQRMANRQSQGTQEPRRGCLAGGRMAFQQSTAQQMALLESSDGYSSDGGDGLDTPRSSSPVASGAREANGNEQSDDNVSNDTKSTASSSSFPCGPTGVPILQMDEQTRDSLPWTPKVKEKDIQMFLEQARCKYIRFPVPMEDMQSMAGLPQPIHEAMKSLRQHCYVSLGEWQAKRDAEINAHPFSMLHLEEIPDTSVEKLYSATYQLLPQYMIALLKVLLAATPSSGARIEPINILTEVIPNDVSSSAVESMILNLDIDRHREIIVKAISSIILLILKHFKFNHIYQFEYVIQHLVFANCMPLILKFFNQNVRAYVLAKTTVPALDFPTRFISPSSQPTLQNMTSEMCVTTHRNLFASINLMRILNKLVKGKHNRIMMLVAFKSSAILKRVLRVRHAMLQLYVLKLLKMQARYFGRPWRKLNMPIMSAIYQKVRHRITDDWAFANDVESKPFDLQSEETFVRSAVDNFNTRRYTPNWLLERFRPVDNNLTSVLNQSVDLSPEFQRNYGEWLEEEVFSAPINWDQLLKNTPSEDPQAEKVKSTS